MIPMTLAEIAEVAGATLSPPTAGDLLVDGPVVTDSREAGPGGLYVARIGEHADGHRYAGAAVAAGAVAVLGSRPLREDDLAEVDAAPVPLLLVADNDAVQEAFARLARAVIDRRRELAAAARSAGNGSAATDFTVIGITGSSGKTSTKDLLGQVLATAGETVAPVGSYNSEVGVPLTVCRITEHTRYLVAEMGASGPGHIRYLTDIAPPDIGIELNVGSAHLGGFGSADAIADTKAELVAALPAASVDADRSGGTAGGLAVLNADDPRVAAMADRTRAEVVTVGLAAPAGTDTADVTAADVEIDEQGRAGFTLTGAALGLTAPTRVRLGVSGEHQVRNALAVIVAAHRAGVPVPQIVEALAAAGPLSRWRMEIQQRPDGVTVINDAYNANPESMAAALRALTGIGAGRRRTVAVLGGMLELGPDEAQLHRRVGRLAADLGVQLLVTVGELARNIAVGASAATAPEAVESEAAEPEAAEPEAAEREPAEREPAEPEVTGSTGRASASPAAAAGVGQILSVADADAARAELRRLLRPGDVVLFKSSRDSGLRYLGDAVAGESTAAEVAAGEGTGSQAVAGEDPAGDSAAGEQAAESRTRGRSESRTQGGPDRR